MADDQLAQAALEVLKQNDQGDWTIPSIKLYPHQWLWDSCFTAIGLRHHDARRAATEIKSLLRGQWRNGMLPHIILSENRGYWAGPEFWKSIRSPEAPGNVATSGVTQPPLTAIAALAVADKLPEAEARAFLKQLYPALLKYHQWLYYERDPDNSGLITLLHPWETGMDNTPPWMQLLKTLSPLWITAALRLQIVRLSNRVRVDLKHVTPAQRLTTIESLKLLHLGFQLRRAKYDSRRIIAHSRFAVESLSFNSILIRANEDLAKISERIAEVVPVDLAHRFSQTAQSLEQLWDEDNGQYWDRRYHNKKLIKVASLSTFLPLYSGAITPERAARLVKLLGDVEAYWPAFPVPTTALNSNWFDEQRYWQGPVWLNMNWLIIEGLKRYGYANQAEQLRQTCLRLVAKDGFYEYFSALSGAGYGSDCFSWTAALTLDLLASGDGGGGRTTTAVQQQLADNQTHAQQQ